MLYIFYSGCQTSWEKASINFFLLQKRLFKTILVGDIRTALQLQKIILQSNSARLLAIRLVTQVCANRKLSGVDGRTSLTFLERFELNECLKSNLNTWVPQSFKKITVFQTNGNCKILQIPTVADRVWQTLVKFAIEPVHEALFHPRNYGFRAVYDNYHMQVAVIHNLGYASCGAQKRILKVEFPRVFRFYDKSFLLENIVSPRSVKVSVSRFVSKDLFLEFVSKEYVSCGLVNLLLNILLDGVEDIYDSVRFGRSMIFFLKPWDNEKSLLDLCKSFCFLRGISLEGFSYNMFSPLVGFDFVDWHFCIFKKLNLLVTPSELDYQNFLLRVKRIINNSNYGSNVKVNKLYPVISQWKRYHKFACLKGARFSLYYVKKKAFKNFSKESRQDFFSTKRLVNKCFYFLNISKGIELDDRVQFTSPYTGHLFFVAKFFILHRNFCGCIHCGMIISL